ncbi:hypothetical protein HZS_3815 [Henneguya salminicola]|nr:hypothetical protein HZS_3815 [Henneguya salminicola]
MEVRKNKLLTYFFISVNFLHSLSITVAEDIIVPCGYSYNIPIEEDPSSWISSTRTVERNNGNEVTLLY